jgi:hypothetical protein
VSWTVGVGRWLGDGTSRGKLCHITSCRGLPLLRLQTLKFPRSSFYSPSRPPFAISTAFTPLSQARRLEAHFLVNWICFRNFLLRSFHFPKRRRKTVYSLSPHHPDWRSIALRFSISPNWRDFSSLENPSFDHFSGRHSLYSAAPPPDLHNWPLDNRKPHLTNLISVYIIPAVAGWWEAETTSRAV